MDFCCEMDGIDGEWEENNGDENRNEDEIELEEGEEEWNAEEWFAVAEENCENGKCDKNSGWNEVSINWFKNSVSWNFLHSNEINGS